MRHAVSLAVGPVVLRVGSAWRGPVAALERLYRGYPAPTRVPDLTLRLEPERPWRRLVRPQVAIRGDHWLPDALPLPLAQGLLAAEMGMNLQVALGWRRHLLLHASSVARGGRALLMTGESGSGKSTLSVLLARRGWRFMGDEFAMVGLDDGAAYPYPRPASLKNDGIAAIGAPVATIVEGSPKGRIGYWPPPADAIARMAEPAIPALLLLPRHGAPERVERLPASEAFMRLTQASTNFVALGEAGFAALTRLVRAVPAIAIDYPDGATGVRLVERLWDAHA